jgi:hypothetical protein
MSDTVLEGGCECGAVRYRMLGPPIFVNCCHCRQCQRIGGSAFALNAMIEKERVDLLAGADLLVREGGETRCGVCRVLLWATHRMFGESILFLRAGTLDEGERLAPNVHFFVRSKHPWVTIPEGVLAFETLPGRGDPPLFGAETEARLKAATGG